MSLIAALGARFQKWKEDNAHRDIVKVADLSKVLGISSDRINDAIAKRPALFPAGIGLDGPGCRREWTYEEALQVARRILNFSPKARVNLGFACFAL